jgi:hypothetical protein
MNRRQSLYVFLYLPTTGHLEVTPLSTICISMFFNHLRKSIVDTNRRQIGLFGFLSTMCLRFVYE